MFVNLNAIAMVMNRKDLSRAFSPGKNIRRSIGKRKSLRRHSIEPSFNANIKVVIRVRPIGNNDSEENVRSCVKVVNDQILVFDPSEEVDDFYFQGVRQKCRDMTKKAHKDLQFAFDKVFDTHATNEQVFCGSTKDIIGSLLDGYNCSVFVYGATGAGKTFTMLGTRDSPGITFHTMVELYNQMELLKEERKFEIGVSYMEVYNETVKDLLSPSLGQLHVREDPSYGVKVQGLTVQRPADASHLLSLLESGNRNRSQHPTDANAESSRSHAVFQVYIKMTSHPLENGKVNEGSVIKVVKLSMIDLAGSERGSATGFKGSRFAEGANINRSLLSLGNCINALADGLKHIPYRNSKLTRLLKDSLGGNCKTVMIANVSPAVLSYEDTYNTLKYADRAKKIKLRTKKNVVSVDMHVTELAALVEDLRQENAALKLRVAELEATQKEQVNCADGDMAVETPVEDDVSSKLSETIVIEKEPEEPSVPSSAMNSTFVAGPAPEPVPKKEEIKSPLQKALVGRISAIFGEREILQRRILQLEAENKMLSWKVANKRRGLQRLQSFCGNGTKEYEKCETKSLCWEEKLALRINRNEERKKLAWSQLQQNGQKIAQLLKEANSTTMPILEGKSSNLKLQAWKCMAEHATRLCTLTERERSQIETTLEKLASTFQVYHSLLSGHGLLTQALEKQYENLKQTVEGIKGVSWKDQQSGSEGDAESTDVTAGDSVDENKGKMNETFCVNEEIKDKDYNFSDLVSLPVDKITEHGLNESSEGKGDGIDAEVATVSDGIAKVQLLSSLAPSSILSSILPPAPLPYQFAAPSSMQQKISAANPRTFTQPKSWNRFQNYGNAASWRGRERSREDKENSNANEKVLPSSGGKGSLTGTPPIDSSNGGSARKMMHLKQKFRSSHPYLNGSRNRPPFEPRSCFPPNLSFLASKDTPSSAR
ncbi:hypothetical protein J437_LFUL007367 [Ladona fulva]|uniref:Kinesin motor domain-containing protein n=1 Tax=Ladona fulva TaxID=123851 RepID=A0A8K0K378_LADFU|nr:hypothetical protein J437_LFUL007367 [Ladona fulva]